MAGADGPRGLVVAAPASGSGKTLVTAALLAAFRRRGLSVASAKAGPDYIDPRFHEAATGRPAVNLDVWAMGEAGVAARAAEAARGADLLLVEGVMGLFDGAAGGGGSTADLARALGLPVVLVVDAARQSGSVAALVHGFATFDPGIDVAGAILTRVASDRHEALLRAAMETGRVPLLGVLRDDPDLALASRHLGLVQAREVEGLRALLDRAADTLAARTDPAAVAAIAGPVSAAEAPAPALPPLGQRIAVAEDDAFAFTYPHLLAGWQGAGAAIVPFSPLADEGPDPDADAVFLPGGYPELHAGRIAAATGFLEGLRAATRRGALVYGECGGFMALGSTLVDAEGTPHAMAGLLGHATSFAERRRTLGYRAIETAAAAPLPFPRRLAGHEFHYAVALDAPDEPLFTAADAAGAPLGPAGGRRGRVCGSFLHLVAPRPG